MIVKGLARIAACLILMLVFASPDAWAQFRNALEGNVTDASGALIPDAQIVLVNIETGISQTSKTNSVGYYRFPTLPPGKYKITASASGFKAVTRENVTVGGDQVVTVPLELSVGEITEQVTVTVEVAPIQKSEAKVGTSITAYEVRNFPLAGRNVLDLIALAPGVTGLGNVGGQAGGNDIFSLVGNPRVNANGQRGDGNSFYVDSNSATSNPDPGTFNIIPNPDSIREFNTVVNDYSAEYGRSGSLVIQAVTKSGTNQIHGSLFEYHRNNRLTARNVFQNTVNPLTGRVIPVSRRNEFGGSVGGPIQKDKMFFFFSYDQLRSSNVITRRITVEAPEFVDFLKANRSGNISTFLLSNFPVDNISGFEAGSVQTVATVMTLQGLGPCVGAGPLGMPCNMPVLGTAIQDFAPTRNGLQWNVRIDRYFNDSKDRLYFNYYKRTADAGGGQVRPAFRNAFASDPISHYAQINWTHTFNASIVNEAAVGFTRPQGNQDCSNCQVPPMGVPGLSEGFGNGFSPAVFIQNDLHWRDIFSVNRGRHTLKAGVDIFFDQENDLFSGPQQRPGYAFLSIFDFAADNPVAQTGINYDLRTGGPSFQDIQYETTTYGFFVQDNWKVKPNLSLNMGLRWDFSSNPTESHNRFSNILLGSGATFQERIANASIGEVPALLETHRIWYFAPRFSFAWAPDRFKGNLSIRGGVGVFMNRWPNIVWSDQTRFNPPYQSSITADRRTPGGPQPVYGLCGLDTSPFNCPFPAGLRLGVNERGGPIGARAGIGGTAPDLRYAYTTNRFFGIQYSPHPDWVIEADYLGSLSVHQYLATNRNRFAGDRNDNGLIDRLNPFFANVGYTDNSGWGKHNGGTLSLRKRFSRGYTLQASFTTGKTISVSDAQGPGRDSSLSPIVDAYDINSQQGLASFDISKRFAFSIVYEVPYPNWGNRFAENIIGGWQVSSIVILQDGYPFWVIDSRDFNGDGQGFDRPLTPAFGNSKHCDRGEFLSGCLDFIDFPQPQCLLRDAAGNCIRWASGGDLGRNTFRGPGYANVDLSAMRNFRIPWFTGKEGARLQFRGEIYNLFNRVNLTNVNANVAAGPAFGRATGVFNPRTVQLGLRIDF